MLIIFKFKTILTFSFFLLSLRLPPCLPCPSGPQSPQESYCRSPRRRLPQFKICVAAPSVRQASGSRRNGRVRTASGRTLRQATAVGRRQNLIRQGGAAGLLRRHLTFGPAALLRRRRKKILSVYPGLPHAPQDRRPGLKFVAAPSCRRKAGERQLPPPQVE